MRQYNKDTKYNKETKDNKEMYQTLTNPINSQLANTSYILLIAAEHFPTFAGGDTLDKRHLIAFARRRR